jgi:hypothetical protein
MSTNTSLLSAERRQLVDRYIAVSQLQKEFYPRESAEYAFKTVSAFTRLSISSAYQELDRVVRRFNSDRSRERN